MFYLAQFSLYWLVQALQPFFVPVCFISAWAIVLLLIWNIWAAMRDGISSAKKMHQIPCANCRFFTANYHLKCPVHPKIALSSDAIDCTDYEPVGYVSTSNHDVY
jgi:hypothetical protein